MSITLTDNQFFTGLANMALFMKLYATNTSSEPKRFIDSFATDILKNGDTKIFPFSDLPQVSDYSETSSLLTVTKVPVNEEVIKITEKKVIKSSYNKYILDMAFTSDSGMNYFVGYILGQMESAQTDYIYNQIITDLFSKNYPTNNKQTNEITVLDTSSLTDPTELNSAETINQKRIALAIQNDIKNISVFTDKYNMAGYKQALDLKDLRLVVTAPYEYERIINLFAELLKSEYIQESFDKPEKLVIPEIKVPNNYGNVIGWLMHKQHYQYFYKFVFMGDFFDVSNLCVHNFLHFWFGKGFLNNLPAVIFKVKTAQ